METSEFFEVLLSWKGARYKVIELAMDRDKVYTKIREFFEK